MKTVWDGITKYLTWLCWVHILLSNTESESVFSHRRDLAIDMKLTQLTLHVHHLLSELQTFCEADLFFVVVQFRTLCVIHSLQCHICVSVITADASLCVHHISVFFHHEMVHCS
jgi:hypothetical protein